MVTFADPVAREQLSTLTEGTNEGSSLEEFINSLDFSAHEKEVITDSLSVLPSFGNSPVALPKNAPDLIRANWWL